MQTSRAEADILESLIGRSCVELAKLPDSPEHQAALRRLVARFSVYLLHHSPSPPEAMISGYGERELSDWWQSVKKDQQDALQL